MKSCITISLVEEARGGPFVLWDGLEPSIAFAGELGYDAVEIFAPGVEAIDVDAVGKMLDSAGLKLAALGTGAGWVKHRLQLADPDQAKRKQAREFVRRVIDCAGQFGASAIIGSMQGPSGHTADAESARSYLCEALQDGGTHAAQYNVPLIYEPLNRYETRQCCTVADGISLLESLSTANVRLLCDLFHMNIEEADIADALRTGGKWVGHVHFVDSNRRPAGLGHLQYGPIIDALRDPLYGLSVRRGLSLSRSARSGSPDDASVSVLDAKLTLGNPYESSRVLSRISRIRRPNLSPILTVSPVAIGWPPTSIVSGSSQWASKVNIEPGTKFTIRSKGNFLRASVTLTGVLIANTARE